MKQRTLLLTLTAYLEVATGGLLLGVPALPISLLLGINEPAIEALILARLAGGALLAIGATCYLARHDGQSQTMMSLIIGLLIYNMAAAGLLTYAGLSGMTGLALWPAVVLHCGMAVWCSKSAFRG